MENWYTQPQRQIFNHSSGECGLILLRCVTNPHDETETLPNHFFKYFYFLKDASPNAYAWKVYSGNFFFQLFIAWVIPGYKQEGLPVPSLNYKTLTYNCNALLCLYTTLITAATLHYYHIFRLTEIIDNYGHLMTVSMIYGFGVSLITYLYAVLTGTQIRMSGNFFYDYFMGACLNPRLGSIDLKMWAEVRIPWVIVFFLSVSGACKQYEQYGYVTPVNPLH